MNDYKKLKQEGQQLYQQGQYQQSINKLTQLLTLLSQQFKNKQIKDQRQGRLLIKTIKLPSLKTISQCQFKLNKLAECQLTCNRILKIDSDCGSTLYLKGLIKIQNNEIEEGLTLFNRMCSVEPDNEIYQKKYQQTKEKYGSVQHTFFDRQVTKISGILGWVLSLVATLIALAAFGYKVGTLVIIFVRNNVERLCKLGKKSLGRYIEWNLNLVEGVWKRVKDLVMRLGGRFFRRKERTL